MAASNAVSLGLGSPSTVEHFITLGLDAIENVLLTSGTSGYEYGTVPGAQPSLQAEPPSSVPTYSYGPEGAA